MSCEEAGVVGGDVGDGGGDVVWFAGALDGLGALDAVDDVLGEVAGHVGGDEARGDDVGGDALTAELAGDGLGECDEARLCGGVVGLAGDADEGGGGGDVDDAAEAALHHGSCGGAHGDEGAGEVDVDDLVPLFVGHAEDEVVAGDAGVVDEDVEATQGGGELVNGCGPGGAVADVAGVDGGGAAGGFDLGLGFVERAFGA